MYPLRTKSPYNSNTLEETVAIYTTVYLGNYIAGDYTEGHGSHPGVDIVPIIPNDTIFACLDGVVQTVGNNATNGNYIVLRHDNVPDPSNFAIKTTLYSCHLHLSKTLVSMGQRVQEGDSIGLTGNTGNSSGEHLHFQLDRSESLFHPYWPFTFAQANTEGLGFFDAVNKGLGIEDARKFTVNPLVYLDKVAEQGTTSVELSNIPSPPVTIPVEEKVVPVEVITVSVPEFSDVSSTHPYITAINFLKSKNIVAGNNGQFFPDATITRAELLKMVFGAAGVSLVSDSQNYFSDIDTTSWQAPYANTAKVNKIIGGYSDGTFRPNNPITRAEAFKIIINTFNKEALDLVSFPVFNDVAVDTWYASYALFAKTEGLIDFSENTFAPDQFITRSEVANAIYVLMDR